jgi:hypothetical protein
MLRRHLARFVFAVLPAFAFVACADQSPVGPDGTSESQQYDPALAQPVEGTYTMSFLPTGSGLGVILVAYVADASGPAESGTAIFQYCALHGDPAPSADCDTGSGNWVPWGRAGILPPPSQSVGFAFLTYDLAPTAGTTIGFRFRYTGQGSGIANGVSAPADHTF